MHGLIFETSFILGNSHEDDPPMSGGQNGCHGNTGCLAAGLKILGFITTLTTYCKHLKLVYMFTTRPL